MRTLRKYGRIWHLSGEEVFLTPWAEDLDEVRGTLVKKNKNRFVWRVRGFDGADYFVKRERRFNFPFVPSKAEREFKSYELLEKKNLPCAEYVAWSATLDDCVIVSRALPPRFHSVFQHWYSTPECPMDFLRVLCDFLADVAKAGIFHPDLHIANLMTDGEDIVLIDLAGISEAEPTTEPCTDMLTPLTEAFGDIPMKTIAEYVHSAGLFRSADDAEQVLYKLEQETQDRITGEWEKRKHQILSGTSKFATETEPGKFVRNSAWFAPVLRYPEEELEERTFPSEEGEALWLESFQDQLRKRKREKVPVVYEKKGGNVRILFLRDKKFSFFYGFR